MKIVAIAANVAQLIILLTIFFVRGPDLGVPVILLLFLLMPIALINFLALLFSNRPMPESAADAIEEDGMVKREAMRISYREDPCPVLKTGNTAFAVLDLSEGGVRIRASSAIPFKKKVNGDIQLVSGDWVRFKATVMRREEGAVVFQFVDPIGTAILMEEKKALAADSGD